MRRPTFEQWLMREAASERTALLGLYENRDRALYVEAPTLRQRYMERIGIHEEPILRAELEVASLRRKAELIQAALNRREPIDLAAIDARIEEEMRARMQALETADLTLNELPALTAQQSQTLQFQYREIMEAFHPAMNPGLTETERELYQKAVEAYKVQDAAAMSLIYEMLFSLAPPAEFAPQTPEEIKAAYTAAAEALSADYSLAKALYPCFDTPEEDAVLLAALREYDARRKTLEDEISKIRSAFPFNAEQTVNDSAETEAYLAELRVRAQRCEVEKAELETKIKSLTEGI